MTLSAEYSCDEKGDRGGGGGALAHQRRLIRGLFVWATLLTLGLAASLTLHFIHRESHAPHHRAQDSGNTSHLKKEPSTAQKISVTTYTPKCDKRNKISLLQWNPSEPSSFIEGDTRLMVKERGYYFLYLQVTLAFQKTEDYIIDVRTENRHLLRGYINGSNLSTGFMGTAIPMNTGESFTVTCTPNATIQDSGMDTYMGVIKLR